MPELLSRNPMSLAEMEGLAERKRREDEAATAAERAKAIPGAAGSGGAQKPPGGRSTSSAVAPKPGSKVGPGQPAAGGPRVVTNAAAPKPAVGGATGATALVSRTNSAIPGPKPKAEGGPKPYSSSAYRRGGFYLTPGDGKEGARASQQTLAPTSPAGGRSQSKRRTLDDVEREIRDVEGRSAWHHDEVRRYRAGTHPQAWGARLPDQDSRIQKQFHQIQRVLNPRVIALKLERDGLMRGAGGYPAETGFPGANGVTPGPPAASNRISALTLRPEAPPTATQWGWEALNTFVPGSGAMQQGRKEVEQEVRENIAAGRQPAAPLLAAKGTLERAQQERRLGEFRDAVERYSTQLSFAAAREAELAKSGAIGVPNRKLDHVGLAKKYGERWNWKDFGHFLRTGDAQFGEGEPVFGLPALPQRLDVGPLSPWDTRALTSLLHAKRVEANRAHEIGMRAAIEVGLFIAGDGVGLGVGGGLMGMTVGAPVRAARTSLGQKTLPVLEKALTKPGGREVAKVATSKPVQVLKRVLTPTEAKFQNAVANAVQEGGSAAVLEQDPQVSTVLGRALLGSTTGYAATGLLQELVNGTAKLTVAGYDALYRKLRSLKIKPGQEAPTVARVLEELRKQSGIVVRSTQRWAATSQDSLLPGATAPTPARKPSFTNTSQLRSPETPESGSVHRGEMVRSAGRLSSSPLASDRKPAALTELAIAGRGRGEKATRALDAVERAARQRLASRSGRLRSGIDPEDLADLAIIGAAKIGKGVVELAEWTEIMVREFGDEIRPHVDELWRRSQGHFNAQIKSRLVGTPAASVKGNDSGNPEPAKPTLGLSSSLTDAPGFTVSVPAKASKVQPVERSTNAAGRPGGARGAETSQATTQDMPAARREPAARSEPAAKPPEPDGSPPPKPAELPPKEAEVTEGGGKKPSPSAVSDPAQGDVARNAEAAPRANSEAKTPVPEPRPVQVGDRVEAQRKGGPVSGTTVRVTPTHIEIAPDVRPKGVPGRVRVPANLVQRLAETEAGGAPLPPPGTATASNSGAGASPPGHPSGTPSAPSTGAPTTSGPTSPTPRQPTNGAPEAAPPVTPGAAPGRGAAPAAWPVETATATRPSALRDLRRNDLVRDISRPNQPPGVVLEAQGSTAKLRVTGGDGSKRVVKAKVSDLESIPVPGNTPVRSTPGQAPATTATPPEIRTGRAAPKDGAPQPVTVQQRPGAPATADTLVPPQAPAAVSTAGSTHPVAGNNSTTTSKLLHPGDRVLVRRGEQVSAARVVEIVRSTIKVAFDSQPPHTAPVKVEPSQVERISQGDVNASVPADSPEGGTRLQTVGGNAPPLAGAEAHSTKAVPPQSGSGGGEPGPVELANGTRVEQETLEAAADLLALRSKRWQLSGHRTQGELKATIGSKEFGNAARLLKNKGSHAAVQAVLRGRQGAAIPPPTLINPKKPTAIAQRAGGGGETATASGSGPMTVVRRHNMAVRKELDPFGREMRIYGQAEAASSTTPGHARKMIEHVEELVRSGNYAYVTLQRSWRTATGRQVESRLIPDIIAVRRDGRVDAWEVWSFSDNYDALITRLRSVRSTLPMELRGRIDVLYSAEALEELARRARRSK